jgi:hypothetical protein
MIKRQILANYYRILGSKNDLEHLDWLFWAKTYDDDVVAR